MFRQFIGDVVKVLDDREESFWRCREALLALTSSGGVLEYVEKEISRGLQLPRYMPSFTLLECDRFSLVLRFIGLQKRAATVQGFPYHRMTCVVCGSITAHRFEQPQPLPADVFDPARRIVDRGTCRLNSGEFFELRASSECCDLSVEDAAILLELRSASLCGFEWHYDASTLIPKCIRSTSAGDMRAEVALLTAMSLGSSDSVAYIAPFIDHPNPFVRAYAIQAVLKPDSKSANEVLRKAEYDTHPEAQKCLDEHRHGRGRQRNEEYGAKPGD